MRVLFLAPQPFFQERGTPIAVRLALQVLARRRGDCIDLLTYHEGETAEITNVKIHRIWAPWFIKNIAPGISLKKLVCDVIFLVKALLMVLRAGAKPYQLVHAVEESVFVAWLIRRLFGIPYIYDMDSSIAMQLTEKWWLLKPFFPLFERVEGLAIKGALAVVPVCDALAEIAKRQGSQNTRVLSDISLLDMEGGEGSKVDLRCEASLPENALVVLYIGNLEPYQGVDLLIESFAKAACDEAHLVIIGGRVEHMQNYEKMAERLKIHYQVHLFGPRPVGSLSGYLRQADILASPRVRGNNTPMKIYSYLHAGAAILATDLPTHTQVLTPQVACLAKTEVGAFSAALSDLLRSPEKRAALGAAAKELAESRYTFESFKETLNGIYDAVTREINKGAVN